MFASEGRGHGGQDGGKVTELHCRISWYTKGNPLIFKGLPGTLDIRGFLCVSEGRGHGGQDGGGLRVSRRRGAAGGRL